MTSINTVVPLRQPDEIDGPLPGILRSGARRLLAQAIEAEAEAFLAAMKGERLSDRLAPKVLALVAQGRSYRLVGREVGLSKSTVADIAKPNRAP